ncbi:MAG: c-type cytochrome [Myxococcota bacterium]|nr:c-type cytochrome [Myxococcota bacterium]
MRERHEVVSGPARRGDLTRGPLATFARRTFATHVALARRRALATLATLALGCADDVTALAAHASTILVDGDTVLVASPDDDAVVALDATTLMERARLTIAGAPTKLARLDGSPEGADTLVVSLAQAAEVAWIERDTDGALEDARIVRVPVPCGGTGAVLALSTDEALVACPHDDRLVHLRDAAVIATYTSPGRPTALARLGDRIHVGLSRAGRVRVLDAATFAPREELVLESTRGVAAVQLDAFAADGAAVIASYQRVDFDRDRTRDPRLGGYGAVNDGTPRLEPRLLAPCGGRYARFDGGERVASGPSALAFDAARRRLWIAHRQTGNVVLVACDGRSARTGLAAPSEREAQVLGAVYVGRGLEGLALADDGAVFVDVAFDHAIAKVREVEGAPSIVAQRTRSLGATAMSAAALRGRALFHDARDTQLTPSGVVTCASCHPGGGEDGLAWFLHTSTVGPKLRRTPPAWGARTSLAPYHWDGEHESARELTLATIRALLEGDGLLVELDAIAAYLEELAPPPPRPADDPAAAARGRALFDARCASCHPGGGSDGLAHPIAPPSEDAAARLERAFTPTLQAVRARPPYLHDGRAATLRDVLTTADPDARHGAADLSAPDLDDLVAYLETL